MNLVGICSYFGLKGSITENKKINSGHINGTYRITFDNDGETASYIIQRINKYVFKNPAELMKNVCGVTEYIRRKIASTSENTSRDVLYFLPGKNGLSYYLDGDGEYWRCYKFVENSLTYDFPEKDIILASIGGAFGRFHNCLCDYDTSALTVTIPDFHNTAKRLDALFDAYEKNPMSRAENVREEIEYYKDRYGMATSLLNARLPVRVVHNDPKCNNVLFDTDSGSPLAVIDLDTVMPGIIAYDFGDAVRSACNSCPEDEKDYEKVHLDLDKFRIFTENYLSEANFLTENEKASLPVGVFVLAIELSARFLTDYLLGDRYFAIDYGKHNLVRAMSQLALAKDIEKKLPQMKAIIEEYK